MDYKYRILEIIPTVQYGNIQFEVFGDTPEEVVSSMKRVQDQYREFYAKRELEKIKVREAPKETLNF